MFDEYGPIPCDDWLARMDITAHFLQSNPAQSVFVSIAGSGESSDWRWVLFQEGYMKGYLRDAWGIDISRVSFERSKPVNGMRIRVWTVPPVVPPPKGEPHTYDLQIPEDVKPFVWFYSGSKYPYPICAEWDGFESYTELLTANPTAKAHVVIATTSPEAFEKKKVDVAKKLVGIDSLRIRYFFEKYDDYPGFEFWIVPAKQKKSP
ncbi:MAG TPA: hypothetical protein VMM38_08005 [Aridibacter sp.]|nr:hypothetical protein [Aridibacter sp.]